MNFLEYSFKKTNILLDAKNGAESNACAIKLNELNEFARSQPNATATMRLIISSEPTWTSREVRTAVSSTHSLSRATHARRGGEGHIAVDSSDESDYDYESDRERY